jgi:hypothetical protein
MLIKVLMAFVFLATTLHFSAVNTALPASAAACVDHAGDNSECCGTALNPDPDYDNDTHIRCPRKKPVPVPVAPAVPITNAPINTNTNTNTATSGASATGGNATAIGGNAGASANASIAPGAIQQQYAPTQNAYVSVSQPQVIQNAALANCDSSGALSFGLGVSAVSGGFLAQGTQYSGTISYSTPVGRHAKHCDVRAPEPRAAIPQPVNVYITNPPAPTPVIQMVAPSPAPAPRHASYAAPRCAPITHARRAALLSKKNPHGVYRLARTHHAAALRAAMRELQGACVDFASAIDG